jgi:hypothetical protein
MGFFRFRRSIRILPGVRLNLGKRSASVSLGVRGAHVTLGGPQGTRTTVGIPGTGLSYTDTAKPDSAEQQPQQAAPEMIPDERAGGGWLWLLLVLVGVAVAWALVSR